MTRIDAPSILTKHSRSQSTLQKISSINSKSLNHEAIDPKTVSSALIAILQASTYWTLDELAVPPIRINV